ncbi:MAG: hypothetical protein WAQ08_10395 [Aquabacterium sp.]|jgi:hypothetical protein|uniref:hypothetical protein n=1 Tax=Aquabacterium sp. TaxID=1872578 RepID=UPI003BB1840E
MNTIRWTMVAACLSLLAACGGGDGGGGGKKPKPDPQSETPSSLSAAYEVALSYDEDYLDIIDPSTANVLSSVPVSGFERWRITLSMSQSSDGSTQTYRHAAMLYYLDGKVQAVDLARGSSTTPRQVSSITNACRILWHIDSDLTGKNSWLAIATKGTDNLCDTSDDALVLVNSSMSAVTAPNTGTFNPAGLITTGRDAAGNLQSLITFEPSVGRFVHWRLDSSGPYPTIESNDLPFPASADIRWLGLVPGHRDRGIVQVEGTLRMLSWTSTSATLSPTLISGVVPDGPFIATDNNRLYVVRALPSPALIAFDGSGNIPPPMLPLDTSKGDPTQLMVNGDTMWVVQQDTTLATAPSTLTGFNKTTGASREVDRYEVPDGMPADLVMRLAGVNGTRLVYTKPSEDEDDDISLHVIDNASAAPRLLAGRAFHIGAQAERTATVGQFSDATYLLWCDKGTASTPVDCSASRFKSYNMATGTVIALGQNITTTDALAVLDSARLADIYAQHPLITTQYPDGTTTTLWQFKPDLAGSLKFVIGRGSSSAGSSPSASSASP